MFSYFMVGKQILLPFFIYHAISDVVKNEKKLAGRRFVFAEGRFNGQKKWFFLLKNHFF